MKLNDEQEAILELIADKDAKFRAAEVREREIALKQAEDRIRTVREERDKMVAIGAQKGIPWLQLAQRGLGTKHTPTAKAAAECGALLLDLEPVDEPQNDAGSRKFTWDGRLLTVTLSKDDFAPYMTLLPEGVKGEQSYSFTTEGGVLLPVNANDDDTWLNPVVQVVMIDRFRQEAIDWIKEQN